MSFSALALEPMAPAHEALYYHDPNRSGFISILARLESNRLQQRSHMISDLPKRIAEYAAHHRDAYISQNEFRKPNRQVVNLLRLTSHFIDLDTYRVQALANHSPESLTEHVLLSLYDMGIPEPSLVVYSGRGLQLKWLLERPIPAGAAPRWKAVQDSLWRHLEQLGADQNSLDISRVLRIVGSVNERSREVVRITHTNRLPALGGTLLPNGVVAYPFDLFADTVLPRERQVLVGRLHRKNDGSTRVAANENAFAVSTTEVHTTSPEKAHTRGSPALALSASQLAWDRLDDLRTLFRLRGWSGGAPAGQRNTPMFLAACFLATSQVTTDLMSNLIVLAREFVPTWTNAELRSCVSSALSRAAAAGQGELVEYNGEAVTPNYRFSNDTLIDWLAISAAEQCQLKTIIGDEERRSRDRERKAAQRREEQCLTREQYEARAELRKVEICKLRENGMRVPDIAAQLGVSVSMIYKTTACP